MFVYFVHPSKNELIISTACTYMHRLILVYILYDKVISMVLLCIHSDVVGRQTDMVYTLFDNYSLHIIFSLFVFRLSKDPYCSEMVSSDKPGNLPFFSGYNAKCTYDRTTLARCNVIQYNDPLPPQYQVYTHVTNQIPCA